MLAVPNCRASRIGLIGDIHAEDQLLAACLDQLRAWGPDLIIATGDIVDGSGDVDRCIRLLRSASVLCVAGNHERWLLSGVLRELPNATEQTRLGSCSLQYLKALPQTRAIETVAGRLLLCHGLGTSDMRGVRPTDSSTSLHLNGELAPLRRQHAFMACGHTHQRMVRRSGSLALINAGSLCKDQEPCFAQLDLTRESVSFKLLSSTGAVEATETCPLVDLTAMFCAM